MKINAALFLASLFLLPAALQAANLTLHSPLEHQVVQRTTKTSGTVSVAGEIANAEAPLQGVEVRLTAEGKTGVWQPLAAKIDGAKPESVKFQAQMEVPAGSWHRLEVRALGDGKTLAETSVNKFGVGEIFVVAGQSNSANHGEEKLTAQSGRVATFDGKTWRLCADPQPGASGGGGSFMPPFGDAIAARFNVPVGFVACGIGASSVREWLPKGARFPNPPTIEGRVQRLPDGTWESKGQAFEMFTNRMKSLGVRGFRAVLWHQGESDANQRDATRTLAGKLYREYLEKLIRESRQAIGWEAPWFVAQVSYHVPGDEASPDIRDAQASLWKDGVALEGPDSDAMKGEFREAGGKGVHFNGKGLREHASRWGQKVAPWLETQLTAAFVAALEANKPQTVVTYGTSLTAGGAWVGQLQNALNAQFPKLATVINSGQGGMWSKWGVDNLDARVIAKKPDAVFIEFSINDAFLEYKTSPEDARRNLENIIDRIQAANPRCEIILMVMNPPIGVHLERRPKIADYEQVYRDVAQARHLRLIDHAAAWQAVLQNGEDAYKKLVPDGIHPSAAGSAAVTTPNILKGIGAKGN